MQCAKDSIERSYTFRGAACDEARNKHSKSTWRFENRAVLINSLQAVLTAAICALWFHHEDGICWYIDRYRYITLYNLRALYL